MCLVCAQQTKVLGRKKVKMEVNSFQTQIKCQILLAVALCNEVVCNPII